MPKNITNGEFTVIVSQEDKVEQNFKFMRAPNNDSLDILRNDNQKIPVNYYIENIRTGEFSKISQNYMIQTSKEKDDQPTFTTNSFQIEMQLLFSSLQQKMNRGTTFFQGLFSGMALLYTITLNLSLSVSTDLVRVQDQALRIVSIFSSFGSMYSFLIAKNRYDHIRTRGVSSQIDTAYKSLILCTIEMIFYSLSYVIYNISHTYAVQYNINSTNYTNLSQTTTVYTILCLVGWIATNINTYKYQNH